MSAATVAGRAHAAVLCLLAVGLGAAGSAGSVPPPPQRADLPVDLRVDAEELFVRDTVRAYQAVPVVFQARAGDRLLLRLIDPQRVLVLAIESPSGQIWMNGARPGPDGLELWLRESGSHRLRVLMSGDAARAGRSATFELGLRRRQ